MPELPEVETTVRDLRRSLPGKTIIGVSFTDWPNMLHTHPPDVMGQLVAGEQVLEVNRRAKYVLIMLSNDKHLVFHRKMTGNLFLRQSEAEADKYTHFVMPFDDNTELRFADLRKFGRIYLFLARDELDQYLSKLGPEPLLDEFTEEVFTNQLKGRKGALKPLLLNQNLLVGLGNIYVNEALWVSKLHPQRQADTLTAEERHELYLAIRQVLNSAVENRGTTLSDYLDGEGQKGRNQELLKVHEREVQPCYRCDTPIVKINVGQRGTYFCPVCQPAPEGVIMNYPPSRNRKNNHPTP